MRMTVAPLPLANALINLKEQSDEDLLCLLLHQQNLAMLFDGKIKSCYFQANNRLPVVTLLFLFTDVKLLVNIRTDKQNIFKKFLSYLTSMSFT